MLAKPPKGETANGAHRSPPHATTDEGTPDMALHQIQRENGLDLAAGREPNFDERLGRLIRNNWKWALGILITAGYICLPATVWQLHELAAKVDQNQAVIVERLETQATRMAGIEKAADLQNRNTAQIAVLLEKVVSKLDGIDGKIPAKPQASAKVARTKAPEKRKPFGL